MSTEPAKPQEQPTMAQIMARQDALEAENAALKARMDKSATKASTHPAELARQRLSELPQPERALKSASYQGAYTLSASQADVELIARNPEAAEKAGARVFSIYTDPKDGKKRYLISCDSKAFAELRKAVKG
jgi:hypothetical protein